MDGQQRSRGGPSFEPTPQERQLVRVLRANGNAVRVIASLVGSGIDAKTLRKHFRDELREGKEHVVAAVGAAVVKAALAGNMFAARYWLATHGGPEWRVTEGRLIGGLSDAPPVPLDVTTAKVTIYLPDNGRGPVVEGHAAGDQ